MLSKENPGVRKYLGPISKPISRALRAIQIISRNPRHVLKLLFNCSFAPHIQSQPDVYPFAAYLGKRLGCNHVIAIGQPSAKDLIQIYPKFEFIGIVPSADLELCRNQYGFGTWLEENATLAGTLPVPKDVVQRAVIVSKDVDQFVNPASLLKNLKTWLDHAPVCILTSTDRDLDRAGSNGSATTTATRAARWNLTELEDLLRAEGFNLEFIGWTASDNVNYERKQSWR